MPALTLLGGFSANRWERELLKTTWISSRQALIILLASKHVNWLFLRNKMHQGKTVMCLVGPQELTNMHHEKLQLDELRACEHNYPVHSPPLVNIEQMRQKDSSPLTDRMFLCRSLRRTLRRGG